MMMLTSGAEHFYAIHLSCLRIYFHHIDCRHLSEMRLSSQRAKVKERREKTFFYIIFEWVDGTFGELGYFSGFFT
jgi:hypothetical protein